MVYGDIHHVTREELILVRARLISGTRTERAGLWR
jgi:hypothetical protein